MMFKKKILCCNLNRNRDSLSNCIIGATIKCKGLFLITISHFHHICVCECSYGVVWCGVMWCGVV